MEQLLVKKCESTSGGNVGIGTTNPATALEVVGAWGYQLRISRDIASNAQYSEITGGGSMMKFLSATTTGDHSTFTFVSYDGTDELERMRVDASGNVGIGTNNPAYKLEIYGTGDLLRLYSTNTGAGGAQIDLIHDSSSPADSDSAGLINFLGRDADSALTTWASIRGVVGDLTGKGGDITFSNRLGSDFEESMRITHDGNVGIGTTSPTAHLTVNGSPYPYMSFDNSQDDSVANTSLGAMFFKGRQPDGTLDTGASIRARGAGAASNSNNDVPAQLVFATNPGGTGGLVERMVINEVGNVGIGTTTPSNYR